MAPRRPKPKVDNCTYVQQLFKNFLNQNQPHKVSEVFPKSIPRPVQRFPIGTGNKDNLYRQGVKRNLLKVQNNLEQPNAVKEFFARAASKAQAEANTNVSNQPVQARFIRHEGSEQFVKCQLSPNAPPRGLAQWLSFRKKISNEQKLAEHRNKPKKKVGEYLELPETFFSGREPMKLPFEAPKSGDKTLMSVGSTFIPPATSTPFDGKPIVCSPIILDPVELARKNDIQPPAQDDSEYFLKKVGTALDQWCASVFDSESSPLDRNYRTLKEHWRLQSKNMPHETTEQCFPASFFERSSWEEHSMLSNQLHHQHRMLKPSPSLCGAFRRENAVNSNDTSLVTEVKQSSGQDPRPNMELNTTYDSILTLHPSRPLKRKIVDSLLTASPPSPISTLTQIINEDISFGSPLKHKDSNETLQFDFDFTQPNHSSFDDCFSFEEPRRNDSFCFFPPTPDTSDHVSSDDTIFSTTMPRENSRSSCKDSFFDLFP